MWLGKQSNIKRHLGKLSRESSGAHMIWHAHAVSIIYTLVVIIILIYTVNFIYAIICIISPRPAASFIFPYVTQYYAYTVFRSQLLSIVPLQKYDISYRGDCEVVISIFVSTVFRWTPFGNFGPQNRKIALLRKCITSDVPFLCDCSYFSPSYRSVYWSLSPFEIFNLL